MASELNEDLSAVLATALDLVTKERAEQHGDAICQFEQIAAFWSVYLSGHGLLPYGDIKAHHVAQMMVLMKVSRTVLGSFNQDNYTDQAGYSALAFAVQKAQTNAD
ncbi:hypothetical protein UFOVP62_24 [uncultured Caudovirales phage]|uniref:DUF6378 domain-containing protein n=1 Tax=uncultured Caudovirales phage TaxID=2100421 RepID=A0A6J5KU96_9CAUD|nr:hypothetical protein UFOVP62_24 [uncultured Caudovirales phage]